MKGGKDEEKHLDPLFPRIHINDAEKGGGPRAPPRNKMALCEQLTIPVNRFTSGSLSMLPLPPSTTTSTTTSTGLARSASSSNHVSCHKKSMFSPFCSSPGSSDLAGRPHPHASVGVSFNSMLTNPEPRPVAPISYPTSSSMHQLPVTTENSPFQQHSFLSTTNFTAEKIREHDHLRVPTFAHLTRSIPHANARENIENYKHTLSCSNSPGKLQIACEKQLKESGRGLNAIEFVGKQAGGNCKVSQSSEQHGKRLDPVLSTKEKIVIDANLRPLARDNNAEPDAGAHVINYMGRQAEGISKVSETSDSMKRPASVISTKGKIFKDAAPSSLPQDGNVEPDTYAVVSVSQKRSSLLDNVSRLRNPSAQSHLDYKTLQESNATTDGTSGNLETFSRKRSASTIESQLCSIQRLGDEHRSPSRPASVNECSKDQDCVSIQVGIIDRSDGTSETSVVESIAGSVVSPDDVVEVIGHKHFWKARRTIVDQQRIFSVQIFELHRLIKVQRLMAESPEMLFESNFYLGKSSIKYSPMKKLIAETICDPSSPLSVQAKADHRKPNLSLEGTAENTYGKPSPLDNDTHKGANTQHSTPKPCPPALTSPPTAASDIKFTPLLFHPPPGNQWLIPVRSPSEGLVYKPYTGPCPPTAGFLTPVYGSAGPITLPGGAGNFLNTAYCLPASNQQGIGNCPSQTALGQTFIQTYPVPVTNASGSSSTIERISAFSKPQPVEPDIISVPITNTVTPYQNSCRIPSQKSWIVSDYGGKRVQVSKESDLQGSTASSPPERNNGDALSLFPTTPSIHVSNQPARSCSPEQRIQVIKVVPHSRKSASESAARIFRTIQEERKQHD